MTNLTAEQTAFFRLADVCINTLRMGLNLAARKDWLGQIRPSVRQVGFCYGFAEEMAETKLDVDNVGRATFVQLVFEQLFGRKSGDSHVRNLISDETLYRDSLALGNRTYLSWNDTGRTPLPPRD